MYSIPYCIKKLALIHYAMILDEGLYWQSIQEKESEHFNSGFNTTSGCNCERMLDLRNKQTPQLNCQADENKMNVWLWHCYLKFGFRRTKYPSVNPVVITLKKL